MTSQWPRPRLGWRAWATRWRIPLLVVTTWAAGTVSLLASEGGGEADAHGHQGGLLVPPSVWAIVSFLIVLAILLKKILPPIVDVMDRRAQAIRDALEAAEKAKAEREALLATHAQELQRSKDEVLKLIEDGRADAQRARESIVSAARKEAEDTSARARREIEQAKQAAVEELHQRSIALAFDLARRLVEKNLNPDDHQELIQERIRRLPDA